MSSAAAARAVGCCPDCSLRSSADSVDVLPECRRRRLRRDLRRSSRFSHSTAGSGSELAAPPAMQRLARFGAKSPSALPTAENLCRLSSYVISREAVFVFKWLISPTWDAVRCSVRARCNCCFCDGWTIEVFFPTRKREAVQHGAYNASEQDRSHDRGHTK